MNFGKKRIFGMIHLAPPNAIEKALEEIKIYEEEGVYGVIIENYHGSTNDVIYTLKSLPETSLKIGINILPNQVEEAFKIAAEYNVDFIQFDYLGGKYKPNTELEEFTYWKYRDLYPDIFVMGGVWSKYYHPVEGSVLEKDIEDTLIIGCEAIVVTGSGTEMETPLDKIKKFELELMTKDVRLIVGAGITEDSVEEQLKHADGAIVGSAFKPHGNTSRKVERELVRKIMDKVNGMGV